MRDSKIEIVRAAALVLEPWVTAVGSSPRQPPPLRPPRILSSTGLAPFNPLAAALSFCLASNKCHPTWTYRIQSGSPDERREGSIHVHLIFTTSDGTARYVPPLYGHRALSSAEECLCAPENLKTTRRG